MSRIEKLQKLHEAATPGEWFATDDGRVTTGHGDTLFHDDSVLVSSENEMAQAAALHNSWPAIYRVLLAARKFLDQANVIGIYQPPKSHSLGPWPPVRPGEPNAEIELTQYADTYDALVEALRALDGGA